MDKTCNEYLEGLGTKAPSHDNCFHHIKTAPQEVVIECSVSAQHQKVTALIH